MEKYNQVLNIKELSGLLHISISTVRKLIYEGDIPYFKIGNRYYFERKSIEEWILAKQNLIVEGEEYAYRRYN